MIGEKISLAKATPLEKSNALIEKFIEYISAHPELLDEVGIIRQSGNIGKIDEIYKIANEDPAAFYFEDHQDFTLEDPHNVVGVLKRCTLKDNKWSPGAVTIIQNELFKDKFDFDKVIQQLIDNNHFEEAKMLHNILHIGHLAALKTQQNKMTAANLFVVMAPWLARMANSDKDNGLDGAMAMKAISTAQSEDPMGFSKERYSSPFDVAHKEVAQKIEMAHQEIPKRASVVLDKGAAPETVKPESKKRSFKIPSFVTKAIDWTRNTAIPAVTQFITKKLPSWLGSMTGRVTGSKAKKLTSAEDKMTVHPDLIAAREPAEKARKEAQAAREAQAEREAREAQLQREAQAQRDREAQARLAQGQRGVPPRPQRLDVPPPSEPPPPPPDQPVRPPSITPTKITVEERTAMQKVKREALAFFRDLEQKVENTISSKPKEKK